MKREGAPEVESIEALKRYKEISRAKAFLPWFAVSPELKKEVEQALKQEDEELATSGVSPAEVEKARGSLYERKQKKKIEMYNSWLEEAEELRQDLDPATISEIDGRAKDEAARKYASGEIFKDDYRL